MRREVFLCVESLSDSYYFEVWWVNAKQLVPFFVLQWLIAWFVYIAPRLTCLKASSSLAHVQCCRLCVMWGADKLIPPCCGSLFASCWGLTPPSPGLISATLSLGSWHSCPDPCQILGKRQMGLAFYVLIKEEFAPSQTHHLWPTCLVTFIIHPQRGELL